MHTCITSFGTTDGRIIRRGTVVPDDDPPLERAPQYFEPAEMAGVAELVAERDTAIAERDAARAELAGVLAYLERAAAAQTAGSEGDSDAGDVKSPAKGKAKA